MMARLSNAKVVELAKAYKAAKATTRPTPAQAAAEEEASLLRDELLEQLRIRKVEQLELDGVLITRKAKRTRIYSIDRLRERLSRRQLAIVVPPTVDLAALDAAMKRGEISEELAAECLERTDEGKPYIDVRLTKPDE
jgi:hypothetical protein